jgi:hypothetical protein
MNLRIAIIGALLVVGYAMADDDAAHAKLMGSWQDDSGKEPVVWMIQPKGDTLHVTNSSGGRTVLEYDCDVYGHDCAVKVAGKAAKISMWYQGPKLVQMETRTNGYVMKRIFAITGEGDTMDLEQAQISPSPKTEVLHFKRISATTH